MTADDDGLPAGDKPRAEPKRRPCPICGAPSDPKLRPFCSRRCADVDLNRWLSGVYVVPVKEDEDEDGSPPAVEGEREGRS